jgi:hypothetical protein
MPSAVAAVFARRSSSRPIATLIFAVAAIRPTIPHG